MPLHPGTMESRASEILSAAARAMRAAGKAVEARLLALASREEVSEHGDAYHEVLSQRRPDPKRHWEVHLYVPEEELPEDESTFCGHAMKNAIVQALRRRGIDDFVEIVYPLVAPGPPRSNQGKLGAVEWPTVNHDGLIFRSGAEMRFYEALKRLGVTMAPLPAITHARRGEGGRSRLEPDFLIFHAGRVAVVELDGPHHADDVTSEAKLRLSPLLEQGIPAVRIAYPNTLNTEQAERLAQSVVDWVQDPLTLPDIYICNVGAEEGDTLDGVGNPGCECRSA